MNHRLPIVRLKVSKDHRLLKPSTICQNRLELFPVPKYIEFVHRRVSIRKPLLPKATRSAALAFLLPREPYKQMLYLNGWKKRQLFFRREKNEDCFPPPPCLLTAGSDYWRDW